MLPDDDAHLVPVDATQMRAPGYSQKDKQFSFQELGRRSRARPQNGYTDTAPRAAVRGT